MTLEERIEHLEFKMDLLRQGGEFEKFLYDCDITKEQLKALYKVMDEISDEIGKGRKVSSSTYENKILSVVDSRKLDYHFCETFAKMLWEDNCYVEVFPALYSGHMKFQDLFK